MTKDTTKSIDFPTLVISQPEIDEPAARKSTANTNIAVGGILVTLVLVVICVGFDMFQIDQSGITELTIQLNGNMEQDVSSNPNTVKLNIYGMDQEIGIIIDYNSKMSVMWMRTKHGTNCFVARINETSSLGASIMEADGVQEKSSTVPLVFSTNGSPITDISFLGKTARDICSAISTYWHYPHGGTRRHSETDSSKDGRTPKKWSGADSCNDIFFLSACSFNYVCYYRYPTWHFNYTWTSNVCTGPMFYYFA